MNLFFLNHRGTKEPRVFCAGCLRASGVNPPVPGPASRSGANPELSLNPARMPDGARRVLRRLPFLAPARILAGSGKRRAVEGPDVQKQIGALMTLETAFGMAAKNEKRRKDGNFEPISKPRSRRRESAPISFDQRGLTSTATSFEMGSFDLPSRLWRRHPSGERPKGQT